MSARFKADLRDKDLMLNLQAVRADRAPICECPLSLVSTGFLVYITRCLFHEMRILFRRRIKDDVF